MEGEPMALPANFTRQLKQLPDGSFECTVIDPAGNKIPELTRVRANKIGVASKVGSLIKQFDFDNYTITEGNTMNKQEDPYAGLSGLNRLLAKNKDNLIKKQYGDWELILIPQFWASTYMVSIGKINYAMDILDDNRVVISNVKNRYGENYSELHSDKFMQAFESFFLPQLKEFIQKKEEHYKEKRPGHYISNLGNIVTYKNHNNNKAIVWRFMTYDIIAEVKI